MKTRNLSLGALLGFALAAGSGPTLLAQTVVTQLDEDTIRVVQHKGKPPHKRMTISRYTSPGIYAHYVELIDYNPRPLFASLARYGAPGKNLPRTVRRVSGDQQELAEFARFEETTEARAAGSDGRQWRGAPGKARAFAN